MSPSTMLRSLAASTAVALAFSATVGNAAGLLEDQLALGTYRYQISGALAKASGDDAAHLRAGGFGVELEKTLAARADGKPLFVDYPPRANAELLRVIAVVPQKGQELLPIPVCAEQHNKVLGTWNITAKGQVQETVWSGPKVSETPNSSACKAFIMAARAELARIAAGQQKADPQASIPSAAAESEAPSR